MDTVFSVRQISERVKQGLERSFPYVWIQGEVTNLGRPASGHVYFSLREGDALLSCVWFRTRQRDENFDPLTGEVWPEGPRPSLAQTMENGQMLLCAGKLTAYGARSQYQLVVDMAQAGGLGAWHLEFEALKRKLAAEGLFDQERKRPVPASPRRVAVVTAVSGAAIHDFIRIASTRGTGAAIRIHPTPVQGEDAPPKIVAALREAAADGWAEVVVLIRGGGSVQDLWAFNEEIVARAVAQSPVPVLTGIGHEIDHSISDFAADASAATPSHAAQLLWPERRDLVQTVDAAETALRSAVLHRMQALAAEVTRVSRELSHLSPSERLRLQEERLAHAVARMDAALDAGLSLSAASIARLAASLSASSSAVEARMRTLEEAARRLAAAGDGIMENACHRAGAAEARIRPLGRLIGLRQERDLAEAAASLEALDPFAPLKRGYAVARDAVGAVIRSAGSLQPGDEFTVLVADGTISGIVRKTTMQPGARP